eukprot:s11090_g3.t1
MLLEALIFDVGHATGWRIWAWAKLVKDGLLEKKPASYADAMVATAGLLGILGLPLEVQGYWTERSERSVLPTGLSLVEVPPQDKDLLGRWKPEGSDTYARTFAGRVARLQALFAKGPEGQIATIGWMSGRLRQTWFHG